MKKAYRQLIFFVSVVVFLALGPLMVLYAMGYRFNLGQTETLPVGVILIETIPRRTTVSIDGREVGPAPRSIANLEPGPVNVLLSRDGYQSWQKNILVESAVVAEVRSARLFPIKPERQTLISGVITFSLSPNRNLLAVATLDNMIHIIDTNGEAVLPPATLRAPPTGLLWSPDSDSILIESVTEQLLIDITIGRVLPSRISFLSTLSNITWDQRVPGRLIGLNDVGDIIAYHTVSGAREVLASNVKTFATSSRNIFVIDQDNQLITLSLQGNHVDTRPLDSSTPVASLLITPSGDIALYFDDQSLAFVNEDDELVMVTEHALKAGWSPSGQLLYVQTDDTSVHVYNATDERLAYLPLQQLHLVTRLSRQLRDVQWFAGGNHLVYQAGDEIMITEIDTRDHPISYVVDSTNLGQSNVTVGAQGDNMLYIKKTGPTNRLVSTRLVVDDQ